MTRILIQCRQLLVGIMVLQTLLLNGCGYRLLGASAEAPQHFTVAVPVFRNLTYRSAGEGEFTEAVVTSLLRHGVQVRDAATADYIVTGEIRSLSDTSEAFSATDKAVLYRAEAEIEITIRHRQQSEVLSRELVRKRIEYPAQTERALQPSVDSAARRELAEQAAQMVLLRLLTMSAPGGKP